MLQSEVETAMDERLDVIMHHVTSLRDDVEELKDVMRELANAVTRLALVEERQAATSTAIDRLAQAIERIDERVRNLEVRAPIQARVSDWVINVMWAAAAAVVMFILGKTGFFR